MPKVILVFNLQHERKKLTVLEQLHNFTEKIEKETGKRFFTLAVGYNVKTNHYEADRIVFPKVIGKIPVKKLLKLQEVLMSSIKDFIE